MRRYCAALLLTAALHAQPAFQRLAPNGDGSVLYFSSSLRLRDSTNQHPRPKIFVWEAATRRIRLYAQRPESVTGFGPTAWISSTAYNLIAPTVSSDGGTVAITGVRDCSFGTPCAISLDLYEVEVRRPGFEPEIFPGSGSLSPNGRFLLLGSPVHAPVIWQLLTLRDLLTGVATLVAVPWYRPPYRHTVANDGSLLAGTLAEPSRWRSGATGEERAMNVPSFADTRVDASGRQIFYIAPGELRLVVVDVATGTSRVLATFTSSSAPMSLDIADDGSLAAWIEAGQAWIVRMQNATRTRVTNVSEGLIEVALSGDGTKLFAVTAGSRILRIDLRTLAAEEIIPATPTAAVQFPINNPYLLASGGVYEFSASGLPAISAVRIAGREQLLLSASANTITFQVPWDSAEGSGWPELELAVAANTPFVPATVWPYPVQIASYVPAFHRHGEFVAALHEDFSGPVTREEPARAGEIIHVYGRGFGPVSPAPAPGQPAQANPLSVVTEALVCQLQRNSEVYATEVLFAGLAPGWIGLYQLDIRLPAALPRGDLALSCGRRAPQRGEAGGILSVAP